MSLTIQKATLDDLDTLMQWRMTVLTEVFSLPPDAETTALEAANRTYYRQAIPDESHIACLVRRGEKTVGCGGLCIQREMPSPDNPSGGCGYLMNIYTAPEHRKQGIGEQTIRWLTGQARSRGITKIFLETSPSARELYLRLGFRPMPDQMSLDTGEE
jgi:ribosomal protein S18 acetylase RimI-like enzyme